LGSGDFLSGLEGDLITLGEGLLNRENDDFGGGGGVVALGEDGLGRKENDVDFGVGGEIGSFLVCKFPKKENCGGDGGGDGGAGGGGGLPKNENKGATAGALGGDDFEGFTFVTDLAFVVEIWLNVFLLVGRAACAPVDSGLKELPKKLKLISLDEVCVLLGSDLGCVGATFGGPEKKLNPDGGGGEGGETGFVDSRFLKRDDKPKSMSRLLETADVSLETGLEDFCCFDRIASCLASHSRAFSLACSAASCSICRRFTFRAASLASCSLTYVYVHRS
jgi:hypothetical protein